MEPYSKQTDDGVSTDDGVNTTCSAPPPIDTPEPLVQDHPVVGASSKKEEDRLMKHTETGANIIELITLTGRSISLEIDPADTLKNVKDKILEMDGEPLAPHSLILAGKELKSDDDIAHLIANLTDRATVVATSGSSAQRPAVTAEVAAINTMLQLAVPCGAVDGGGSTCGRWSAPGSLYCTRHVGSNTLDLVRYPKLQCRGRTSSGSQCSRVIQDGSHVCTLHQPPTHKDGISCMSMTLRGTMCTRDRLPGSEFCRQHGSYPTTTAL